MRIAIASDLHTEFMASNIHILAEKYGNSFGNKEYDILVLAGDIGSNMTLFPFLEKILSYGTKIVYVPGNHEHYGWSRKLMDITKNKLEVKWPTQFFWLDVRSQCSVNIGGQLFVGDTLWFPSHPDEFQRRNCLADWTYIPDFAEWVYDHNTLAKKVIAENLTNSAVVVTHHAPSYKSITPRFEGYLSNIFFVCDMEKYIIKSKPKLWIHGHMHSSLDYTLDETRIVCNPFGYENEEVNPDFVQLKIVTPIP